MRIITHTCSNTEIVEALGAGEWIVGVDDHSDYPKALVETKARIGPDLDIDIERVIALKPDLVITSLTVPGHERCLERIVQAGLPHLVTCPVTLSDVRSDIMRIGEAIGRRTQAQALIHRFDEKCRPRDHRKPPVPVAVEWWPKPVIVPGQKSWVNDMLALVGGINPFASQPAESLSITDQQAIDAQIEAVIISWCGVDESKYRPHVVTRRPGWSAVPALKNGHIYPISEAWLGRPGPRLIEGLDKLAWVIDQVRADRH